MEKSGTDPVGKPWLYLTQAGRFGAALLLLLLCPRLSRKQGRTRSCSPTCHAMRRPSSCGARGRYGAPTSTCFGARAAGQAGAIPPTSSAIRGCRRCGRQRRRRPRGRGAGGRAGERSRARAAVAPARMTARPRPHLPARARPLRPWTTTRGRQRRRRPRRCGAGASASERPRAGAAAARACTAARPSAHLRPRPRPPGTYKCAARLSPRGALVVRREYHGYLKEFV